MFQYKTPAEIEAMTEYQREKYFDQKREHEAKLAKESAEAAAKEVAEKLITPLQKALDESKEENEKLVKEFGEVKIGMSEAEKKYEAALTTINRLKVADTKDRVKNMSDSILEHFSTEEGEKAFKTIVANKKGGFTQDFDVNVKAVGNMSKPAGSTEPQIVGWQGAPHEIIQARNIIPVSPTNRDRIKYLQYTVKEGAIAPVAAGGLKPEFDYAVTPVEAPVRKIAGHITLEDEFLEDIESARDFLAEELPKAYLDVETRQIFKGSGVGENLSGIYSIWAEDLILPAGNGQVTLASNAWDKIAAALTQVRKNLRQTDAIWISPDAYLTLLINKGNTDEYTYPIVSDVNGRITIGGVPIFQHSIFLPGEGIAGDFRTGTRIFQKKAMTIKTSTEHAENFIYNLTTILIEGRIALPVYFPEAFVKINFATA